MEATSFKRVNAKLVTNTALIQGDTVNPGLDPGAKTKVS